MMIRCVAVFFFCFKQKTAYDMRISDWSSRRVLFRSQRCRGLRRVSPARGAAPCRCDLNELHPLGRAAARTEPRADPGARVPAVLPAGVIVRRGRGSTLAPDLSVLARTPVPSPPRLLARPRSGVRVRLRGVPVLPSDLLFLFPFPPPPHPPSP